MATLVSACLLGFPCRYDSADKLDARVLDAIATGTAQGRAPGMGRAAAALAAAGVLVRGEDEL